MWANPLEVLALVWWRMAIIGSSRGPGGGLVRRGWTGLRACGGLRRSLLHRTWATQRRGSRDEAGEGAGAAAYGRGVRAKRAACMAEAEMCAGRMPPLSFPGPHLDPAHPPTLLRRPHAPPVLLTLAGGPRLPLHVVGPHGRLAAPHGVAEHELRARVGHLGAPRLGLRLPLRARGRDLDGLA
jgi:hypothetical protein